MPVRPSLLVERAGEIDGVLAGQAVGDQQDLVRIGGALDLGRFVHQLLVERDAAGGVEQHHVVAAELGRLDGARGDLLRRLALDDRQRLDVDLLAEHGELLHRRRAASVERGHQDLAVVALGEALRDLGGCGGFAGALQADHHDRNGRGGIEVDRLGVRAERVDQLVVDDLHHHLAGRHRLDDVDADRALLDLIDEGARHLERYVGFEQRAAHLAHRFVDVGLRQRAAPRQAIEHSTKAFRQAVEQRDDSQVLATIGRCKTRSRPRAHRAVGRLPPASRDRSAYSKSHVSIENGRNIGVGTYPVNVAGGAGTP